MKLIRPGAEKSYNELKETWMNDDFTNMIRVKEAPVLLFYKVASLLLSVKMCMWCERRENEAALCLHGRPQPLKGLRKAKQ